MRNVTPAIVGEHRVIMRALRNGFVLGFCFLFVLVKKVVFVLVAR